MDFDRHRARFLIAMGLAEVACSKEGARPETTPIASASAPVTASATPSADPSSTIGTTASATPSNAPTTTSAPKPTPFGAGYSCGFDVVCNPAPKTKPAKPAAAPNDKCAASYTEPATDGGAPPRTGDFYAEAPQLKAGDCCYKLARRFCGGGRPLRGSDDAPIVATMTSEGPTVADAFAARWLREAAFEHASVASFARVSLQLLALGAPPDLLEATNRAALDEIDHARRFLELAKRRGAGESRPGPLDVARAPLETTFASFVTDTFLDGCVAETISGIEIRACADDGDDVERNTVARIADDEHRHAELAWRMLAWAVREGGKSARDALEEAIGRIDHDHPIVRDVVLPCAEALSTKVARDEHVSNARA